MTRAHEFKRDSSPADDARDAGAPDARPRIAASWWVPLAVAANVAAATWFVGWVHAHLEDFGQRISVLESNQRETIDALRELRAEVHNR